MESIRSLYKYLVDVFGRWWSRILKSTIFRRRELTLEQIAPQEPNSDEEIEAAEVRPAAVYITDVLCMFGTPFMHVPWIKNMLTPYGRIKYISCFRVMPYVWSYLVIFASEDEAKAAFIAMQNPPHAAKNFKFNFVHHEKLMSHYILHILGDSVVITDY